MSEHAASDLAASRVEQILAAAQEAAEQIRARAEDEAAGLRADAERASEQLRARATRDSEQLRTQAARDVEQERSSVAKQSEQERVAAAREAQRTLDEARRQASELSETARRESEAMTQTARRESHELREETKNAVEGRVAAAEQAAADVLAEARTLSGGLRQLGRSLEEQADRILRDVQAAHKRMQSDLHIAVSPPPERASHAAAEGDRLDASTRRSRRGSEPDPERKSESDVPARRRANPFADLDVPNWVGRDG